MIVLLSESARYIPYIEKELQGSFSKREEQTPEGTIVFSVLNQIIMVENILVQYRVLPYLLEKYDVKFVGLVSKVGGINRLVDVGDIIIMDDYIDQTTLRPKSFLKKKNPMIKIRYDMNKPFCENWGKRFRDALIAACQEKKINIFSKGTYVCTDGPGFESDAEIAAYRSGFCDMVGHSVSPLVYYLRELGICFLSVGVVSNVYFHENPRKWDEENNNMLFGKLYKLMAETAYGLTCSCQERHIIQKEEYGHEYNLYT